MLVTTGIALAAGAIGWAGATVFAPPAALPQTDYALARVVPGEVSSTISLTSTAEWVVTSTASNQATGVVTSVGLTPGAPASAGTVLYTVGLRPVVLARGGIPAFRPLGPGSVGADVAQLQAFLAETGYYTGPADGQYGAGTGQAVEAWQRELGMEPDGTVQTGDLVFVPEVPVRIVLDDEAIIAGATLGGAERVIGVLAPQPRFTVTVSAAQATVVPDGTRVEITGPEGDLWVATVVSRHTDDEGSVVLALGGDGGDGVCGETCGTIPIGAPVPLDSSIVLIEPTAGLMVPTASLVTRSDGALVVVDIDGEEHPVTVVASARGSSIIEGVAEGLSVRIPRLEAE